MKLFCESGIFRRSKLLFYKCSAKLLFYKGSAKLMSRHTTVLPFFFPVAIFLYKYTGLRYVIMQLLSTQLYVFLLSNFPLFCFRKSDAEIFFQYWIIGHLQSAYHLNRKIEYSYTQSNLGKPQSLPQMLKKMFFRFFFVSKWAY